MILRALKAALVWMFGDENGITVGNYCNVCADVHPVGHQCARALVATCQDCKRRRTLDRFGNCPCGSRSVGTPRLKFPHAHRYNGSRTA